MVIMAIVEPLVSFTVQNLGNLLIEEGRFLGAVREQVEEMKTELTRMQSFLTDADRRRGEGDAGVTNLVVEIRELAYDAEEVIATFTVKVAASDGHSYLKRCFCFIKTSVTRHVVSTKIQKINNKIAGLTRSLQTYGVQATAIATEPRKTYSIVFEENVVGLEGHVRRVVAHLKDRTHSRIISSWGTGGLGKTTFSKEIHRHIEVKHYFDHIAWVCVSQQCNPDQVWRDILLQFADKSEEDKEIIRKLTSNELVYKLYSLQMEKTCLVILDDIWKQEDWTSLCPAFPKYTETGSKIMLTTRNKGVVSHADIQCLLYELPFLKKEDCLELLEKKLSRDGQGFSTEMHILIEEIVGCCRGLPLAIVLVGGLLAKDKTLEWWEKVRQDLSIHLNKGDDRNRGVQDVLALSYQDLPYYLKACFLYLSLFPEDYEIEAKELVQMWIAEGFVSSDARGGGTKTMLDIGLSYLDELVNRCMVQAKITRFSRRVQSIRLHDFMREFCLSKAQEENFSRDISLQSSSLNTIRRLAVYLKDGQQQEVTAIPNEQHEHVRSCLVHGDELKYWDKTNSLLKGFKFLKVLNLAGSLCLAAEGQLSKDIGKLKHLRFIRFPQAGGLPSSLGNLILLQTLDLRSVACTVPNVLGRMTELRHLYLPVVFELKTKLNLAGLSKLETLVNVDSSCCDVGSLCELRNIRKLVIECTVGELAKIFEYPMFKESQTLMRRSTFTINGDADTWEESSLLTRVLACPRIFKFSLRGRLHKEISIQNLNRKITRIAFSGCRLEEDPMPFLGMMPNLRSLELSTGSYIGKKMVCLAPTKTTMETSDNTGGFPQLTSLSLIGLRITVWEVNEGAMPCLSLLELINCKELKEIPDGLKFITTLQKLNLTNVNESLKRRLQGGKDFQKIVCIV